LPFACPRAHVLPGVLDLLLRGGPGDLRAAADQLAALLAPAHEQQQRPAAELHADEDPSGSADQEDLEGVERGHFGTVSFAS
jgi:hypothetical protein